MSDQMKFPDTWEEFEKHYGFYDIKNVYTFGNLRLIPSFSEAWQEASIL